MRYRMLLLAGVVLALIAWGCSDDSVTPRPHGNDLAEVDIAPGQSEFTVTVFTGGTPQQPITGPFVIHGTNIHYDAGWGALVVDLTITNAGPNSYPLPVRLEFAVLAPAGVRVLNSSNGVEGVGAQIDFHFTDRDTRWTPGETSQPRTVQFGVDDGVSIGFGARILVGPDPDRGVISGIAFFDADEDGVHDPGEGGIAGREIHLAWTDSLFDCIPELDCPMIRSTTTDINGEFRFDDLDAGFYTVIIVRDRCSHHTTPTELQVILVEDNGVVSDFHDADFGLLPVRDCWCVIENGDFSAGLEYWTDESSGPGKEAGVVEIVDVDGRDNVLHLDSRASGNYYLYRSQKFDGCGVVDHALSWDWKIGSLERSFGLAAVWVEFYDGADAPIGRYFVRRHTGDYGPYWCDNMIASHLRDHPTMFVSCEEEVGTSFDWETREIVFNQTFFENVFGPGVNPVASLRVYIESYNNAGAGVDAYFDNFAYRGIREP